MREGWDRFETQLGTGPLHGDFKISNLLATPEGPLIMDLDYVRVGPWEWDLATISRGRHDGWDSAEWVAFSAGYGHDLRSQTDAAPLRELTHLGALIFQFIPHSSPLRLPRGRALLDSGCRPPEALSGPRLGRRLQAFPGPAPGTVSTMADAPAWSEELAWELGRRALDWVALGDATLTPLKFGAIANFRVKNPARFLKVADPGFRSAQPVLGRSLELCAWLADRGFPVADAAEEGVASPIAVDGAWAGLWKWEEHREVRPDPERTGEVLRRLHALLSDCPVDLPELTNSMPPAATP